MSPSHFILNSDFPMEKIIYFYEFEDTLPQRVFDGVVREPPYSKTITCDGIKGPLLVFAIFSTNPDFSDSMASGGDSLAEANKPAFRVFNGTTDGKCEISVVQQDQNYNDADVKFYMRIYGFARVDSVERFIPTQRSSGRMLVNTDYDYLPLVFSAVLSASIESEGVKEISVEHGRREMIGGSYEKVRVKYPDTGALPIVKFWPEGFGVNEDYAAANFTIGEVEPMDSIITVDEDECVVEINLHNAVLAAFAEKLHVRIYLQ